MAAATLDISTADPADLARIVADTPDSRLCEGMRGAMRGEILDEVFARMERHFMPERAGEVDAVVLWSISGRPGGGFDEYEMSIRDGECRIMPGGERRPRVTLTVDPVSFLKLVTGNARGPGLLLRGRLKAKGDTLFAHRLPGFFRIPDGA